MTPAPPRRGHGRPGRKLHRPGNLTNPLPKNPLHQEGPACQVRHDSRNLIDTEPKGPGDRARLGRCRVRPAPDHSKKTTGLRPQIFFCDGCSLHDSFPWQAGRLPYLR